MPRYLVEVYLPRLDRREGKRAAAQARAAAEESAGDGIRYLRSILLPEDETCFHLFEAPSAAAVGLANERAALDFERIVETI